MYMQKHSCEGIERRGTTRDGRASPTGREAREEFESMQERRKQFVEKRPKFTCLGSALVSRAVTGVSPVRTFN